MPLQLNLLHEEISEQRQRQRDPLKLSIYIGVGIAALLALNYLWTGYRVLDMKRRAAAAQREWEKVEPQVTAAQKRAAELNGIISTAKTLDGLIDTRFYWAPVLEKIARCVTPNVQITSLDGVVTQTEETKGVTITLEGLAAGREPREVAEDFRQMLLEQMGKEQPQVAIEFRALEDLDTLVSVGGNNVATARFVVTVSFSPFPKAPAPTQDRKAKSKKEES